MIVKVISSAKELLTEEQAKEVYAPTTTGIIGILPGHINLVSTLEVGELRIKKADGEVTFILNGGFIQVKDDEILVLADDAKQPSELVKEEIDEAIRKAEEKISSDLPPSELIELEKILRYERFKQQKLEI